MADPEFFTVKMGNPGIPNHIHDSSDNLVLDWVAAPGAEAVTTFLIPFGWDTQKSLAVITGVGGLGEREFQLPPLWVTSDRSNLAVLLGAFYNCEVRT